MPAEDCGRALRWRRYHEAIHRLGARVQFEFSDELARRHPELVDELDDQLARYAGLDPGALRAAGGDRFAANPIRIVGGRR